MPENLKALRKRVRSIKSTKQITRAMEMVAAAKLRRSSAVMERTRPYAGTIQKMLSNLAEGADPSAHPLFAKGSPNARHLVVAMTSDRGLCGSFNANLTRIAEKWVERNMPGQADYYCVGRKALDHFKRLKAPIVDDLCDLGGRVDPDVARDLANDLTEKFLNGSYQSIHIVYANFISNLINRPVVEQFLPLEPEGLVEQEENTEEDASEGTATEYLMEPNPQAVFEALLPMYLRSKIHIIFAELFTSEHSARMMAMSNATKNCDEMGEALTLRMNKARQASITTEILEVVGGAEALKG